MSGIVSISMEDDGFHVTLLPAFTADVLVLEHMWEPQFKRIHNIGYLTAIRNLSLKMEIDNLMNSAVTTF